MKYNETAYHYVPDTVFGIWERDWTFFSFFNIFPSLIFKNKSMWLTPWDRFLPWGIINLFWEIIVPYVANTRGFNT